MKTLFFTGKGGVGKSTIAAAAAWQLAHRGHRVLAVSLDPAHNLGDLFGQSVGDKPRRLSPCLSVREVSLERAAKAYIRQNEALLGELYGYLKPLNFDRYFSLLRYSPGVEEYAALVALEELLASTTGLDFLLIDTPPTALALRILALPRLTLDWLDRLIGIRRAILDKRHTIHNLTGSFDTEGTRLPWRESDDTVMRKLQTMRERYTKTADTIRADGNGVVLVLNPDSLCLKESRRIVDSLRQLAIPLRLIVHNKLTPSRETAAAALERTLPGSAATVPVIRVKSREEPPPPDRFPHDLARVMEEVTGHE